MNKETILKTVLRQNFRARDRDVEKIVHATLDVIENPTFITDDIKVEEWMDSQKFRPVYVVCRDYSGASYEL